MKKERLKDSEGYTEAEKLKKKDSSGDSSKQSDMKKKIDNFFYHYKFHTVVGVFLVFVLIWVAVTSVGKNTEHVYVGYIGEQSYMNDEHREKSETLTSLLGDKIGASKTELEFSPLQYLNDEQIKKEKEKAKAKGEEYLYYPEKLKKNYESFVSEIESGDIGVWFVSKEVYERMDKSRLMRVEDVLGYSTEYAFDEYAVDCSKIDFSHVFARETSYNTLLILRGNRDWSSMMSEKDVMAELELDKAVFKSIVEYKK